ncbi:histidine phosphotransferase family protein [Frigidibacter oleivorans]|uniref:histidine phosphotransferase family protein n=1 Tax=Frigidibacter oleivorans TaxID=2487129 RepID=UPI000F8F05E7|nr:histidine phosphotransferase family protein [Frigidibacter oleivorans]
MSLPPDLPALLGSRICHDLISPLGAIGNGVELLTLTGGAPGAELALVSESVAAAAARVRFFRVAFGSAAPDQRMGQPEIAALIADATRGGRLRVQWQAQGDLPRREVKLAFLMIQCAEWALAWGGTVEVGPAAGGWRLAARAPRLKSEPGLWAGLAAAAPLPELTPAQVQFALARDEAARQARRVTAEAGETAITLGW